MRRRLILLLAGMLGLLSLWMFRQGTSALGKLSEAGEKVSVVCRRKVPSQDAWEILEETDPEETFWPVFWMECEGVQARCGLTGKSVSVCLICTAGNAELLFPGGNALDVGDAKGCLVDQDTARELFGSGAVIGQILDVEGEDYEIRGVLEGQKGTVVIQKTEETAFDTVTAAAGEKRQEEIRELLEGRYGIQGDLEEWGLLCGMAKLVLYLFPLAVLVTVLGQIMKSSREAAGRGEKLFWRICFWAGLLGGLCWTAVRVRIPSDMIPSTWSDFGFWENLWEEKIRALSFLLGMKIRMPELSYRNAFYRCVIFGFLSLLLYFPALICYTYRDRLPSGYEE